MRRVRSAPGRAALPALPAADAGGGLSAAWVLRFPPCLVRPGPPAGRRLPVCKDWVFGGCTFPPVSLGPAGDCPCKD